MELFISCISIVVESRVVANISLVEGVHICISLHSKQLYTSVVCTVLFTLYNTNIPRNQGRSLT